MSSLTSKLKLYKADSSDAINVQSDVNQNYDIIDRHATFYTENTNILPADEDSFFGQPVYWPNAGLMWGQDYNGGVQWYEQLANPSWLRLQDLPGNVAFTIPSSTDTLIPFNAQSVNTSSLSAEAVANPRYIQVNEVGIYLFTMSMRFTNTASGNERYFSIQLRDSAFSTIIRRWETQCWVQAAPFSRTLAAIQLFTSADIGKKMCCQAWQNTGANLNLDPNIGSGGKSVHFTAVKLSGVGLATSG